MNLLAVLKENLTDTVVSRAAYYVDETPEKTRTALEGLVHTVVAGLMKRTTTEIGVNQLFNHIQKGKFTAATAAGFADTLKDPEQTARLVEAGNTSISHLLPAMKSSVGTMVSSYANIKNSAAITLLGMITPMVLGVLNQLVQDKKYDADGLAAMLADQRDPLVEATPERLLDRMGEGLGIRQLLALGVVPAKRSMTVDRPQRPTSDRFMPEPDEESNGSLAKWGVGALVLLALAAGGYYIWNNTQNYSEANQEETAISADFTDSTTTLSPDTTRRILVRDTSRSTVPVAATATAPTSNTALAALSTYLTNPQAPAGRVFRQPALTFTPGTPTPTPAAQAAITELANLMKTNPNLQVQIIAYANDAQQPLTNRALSFARANVVKKQLVDAGINFVRVDAIGRGTGVTRTPGDSAAAARPTRRGIDLKVVIK